MNAQVVVLDKLDYCASLQNLDSVKDLKNFKVILALLLSVRMHNSSSWKPRAFLGKAGKRCIIVGAAL